MICADQHCSDERRYAKNGPVSRDAARVSTIRRTCDGYVSFHARLVAWKGAPIPATHQCLGNVATDKKAAIGVVSRSVAIATTSLMPDGTEKHSGQDSTLPASWSF